LAPFERTEAVKRRENVVVGIVLCGAIPFFVESVVYSRAWAGLALKAYLLTALIFSYIFLIRERGSKREPWLWKAMVRLIPIHIVIVAVFLYLNVLWINVSISPLVSYFILFIVAVVESSYFLAFIDRSRPSARAEHV
jgi:hypothetical protein